VSSRSRSTELRSPVMRCVISLSDSLHLMDQSARFHRRSQVGDGLVQVALNGSLGATEHPRRLLRRETDQKPQNRHFALAAR